MKSPSQNAVRALKVAVFTACLGPAGVLLSKGLQGQLGANPVDVITRSTGKWTLTFLLITLSITPLRKVTSSPWLVR